MSFLSPAPVTAAVQAMYDDDLPEVGFVMNATRVWAHQPAAYRGIYDLIGQAAEAAGLTTRQRGILICAATSTLGDGYCPLAWGARLAGEAGTELVAGLLQGDDRLLDGAEQALARWARQVIRDPNAATATQVQALREAGFDDAGVLAVTLFVALRQALSSVHDALGAQPDHALADAAPQQIRDLVTWGRPRS